MIRRIAVFWVILLAMIVAGFACNVQEYNLRAIYDVDREYISPDSTTYNMEWKTQSWREDNAKYWASSGVIITNPYNVFKQPYWLYKLVNAYDFQGAILVEYDPQLLNIDYMAEASGTFMGDIFDKYTENSNEHLLTDEDGAIVFSDPYYILDPAALDDATFVSDVTDIFTDYISTLHVYLGNPENITYGFCFPEYNWQTYSPSEYCDTSNVDPFALGKTLDTYSTTELGDNVHPYQNSLIMMMNKGGMLITKGDRFDYETPTESLLATRDVNGVFFEDVSSSSLLSFIGKVTSYRTAYTPTSEEQSLMLIAGVKTDIYNTGNKLGQAQMFKAIIDAGCYFTPGYDGTKYVNFPDQKLQDWWLRSSDDSNWGTHHLNPTFASESVSPRKVITTTTFEVVSTLGSPAYASFHYKDYPAGADLDYDSAALNDVMIVNSWALQEDNETAWIGFVDSVRVRNPDFMLLHYTSVHPRKDSEGASTVLGKIWAMTERMDARLLAAGSPYGAWLRDTSGTTVENYNNATRILNPAAYADGLCDSLAFYYVDELQSNSNDGEYTGFFIDWLQDNYPGWSCEGEAGDPNRCGTAEIDMNGDGVSYYIDGGTERALYNAFALQLLKSYRAEFDKRGMRNRLLLANGDYTRKNQAGANYADGLMYEKFNEGYPGVNSEAAWDDVMNNVSEMFVNAHVDPPLIIFETSVMDSSSGKMLVPLALAGNGVPNVKWPTGSGQGDSEVDGGRLGGNTASGIFGLPDDEKLIKGIGTPTKQYIDSEDGTTATFNDTIVVTYDNLVARSVLKEKTTSPWPYLVLSTEGDTLSVGGGWRNTAPPDTTKMLVRGGAGYLFGDWVRQGSGNLGYLHDPNTWYDTVIENASSPQNHIMYGSTLRSSPDASYVGAARGGYMGRYDREDDNTIPSSYGTYIWVDTSNIPNGKKIVSANLVIGVAIGGSVPLSTGYAAARVDTHTVDYDNLNLETTWSDPDPSRLNIAPNKINVTDGTNWATPLIDPGDGTAWRDDLHDYGPRSELFEPGETLTSSDASRKAINLDLKDALQQVSMNGNLARGILVCVYMVGTPSVSGYLGYWGDGGNASNNIGGPEMEIVYTDEDYEEIWEGTRVPFSLVFDDNKPADPDIFTLIDSLGWVFSSAAYEKSWETDYNGGDAADSLYTANNDTIEIVMHSREHKYFVTPAQALEPCDDPEGSTYFDSQGFDGYTDQEMDYQMARVWTVVDDDPDGFGPITAMAPADTLELLDIAWVGGNFPRFSLQGIKHMIRNGYRSSRAMSYIDPIARPLSIGGVTYPSWDNFVNMYAIVSTIFSRVGVDHLSYGSNALARVAFEDNFWDYVDECYTNQGRSAFLIYAHGYSNNSDPQNLHWLGETVNGCDFIGYKSHGWVMAKISERTFVLPDDIVKVTDEDLWDGLGITTDVNLSAAKLDSAKTAGETWPDSVIVNPVRNW